MTRVNQLGTAMVGLAMIAATGFAIIVIYTISTLAEPVAQATIAACSATVRNGCL